MTKQYVCSVEDIGFLVTANLSNDNLDFVEITGKIEQYGKTYMMVDFIETAVTFGKDGVEQSFHIIKFLEGEYLLIVCNGKDSEYYHETMASEVIEHLQQFLDTTIRITLEQSEQLNVLIEKLIK